VSFRRAFSNNNYGVSCLLLGEVEEARKLFENNVSWGKSNKFSLSRVMGTSYLGDAMVMAGDLQIAFDLLLDLVRYVHEQGLQEGAVFSKTNLVLGSIYYEWNKLPDARLYYNEGVRLAEQGGYLDQLLTGCLALARIQYLQGGPEEAQETIQKARRMADRYEDPPAAAGYINAMEADLAQLRGALILADNWLSNLKPNNSTSTDLFGQYELATLARVLAAKGDFTTACEAIKPRWELALRKGRAKDAIACDVLMAKCLFMKGEPLPARAILLRALYKAEPNHFVRSFLDEGGVVISMIKQLLASRADQKPDADNCSTEYLYFLLDEAGKDTLQASTGNHPPAAMPIGQEPLTDQELRILRMLEAGYQNKQIGQELNISLNTVKYHLKNIFGKLGVVNRTQAARIIRKED
jgi:LuxR family maltose regulon positive regulatory protein